MISIDKIGVMYPAKQFSSMLSILSHTAKIQLKFCALHFLLTICIDPISLHLEVITIIIIYNTVQHCMYCDVSHHGVGLGKIF